MPVTPFSFLKTALILINVSIPSTYHSTVTFTEMTGNEGPKDAESRREEKLVEYVSLLPYAKLPLRRALQ